MGYSEWDLNQNLIGNRTGIGFLFFLKNCTQTRFLICVELEFQETSNWKCVKPGHCSVISVVVATNLMKKLHVLSLSFAVGAGFSFETSRNTMFQNVDAPIVGLTVVKLIL
jgi:hypothetical protein